MAFRGNFLQLLHLSRAFLLGARTCPLLLALPEELLILVADLLDEVSLHIFAHTSRHLFRLLRRRLPAHNVDYDVCTRTRILLLMHGGRHIAAPQSGSAAKARPVSPLAGFFCIVCKGFGAPPATSVPVYLHDALPASTELMPDQGLFLDAQRTPCLTAGASVYLCASHTQIDQNWGGARDSSMYSFFSSRGAWLYPLGLPQSENRIIQRDDVSTLVRDWLVQCAHCGRAEAQWHAWAAEVVRGRCACGCQTCGWMVRTVTVKIGNMRPSKHGPPKEAGDRSSFIEQIYS